MENPLKSELSLLHIRACVCVSDPTPELVTVLSYLVSGRILVVQHAMAMGTKVGAVGRRPAPTDESSACHLAP